MESNHLRNRKAAQVEAELQKIISHCPDFCPAYTVRYAKSHTSSAIHSTLEWNGKIAAQKYRRFQAMQLIRGIEITV